jgi:hypothetical protein
MNFTVTSANNPVWSNLSNSAITLNVQFQGFDYPVQFTASQSDSEQHGRELFERAAAGEFGSIAAYVAPVIVTPPAPTKEQLLAQLNALSAQIQALE